MNPAMRARFATGFAALDGSCWANLRSGDLWAGSSWTSFFLPSPAMFSGDFVECRRLKSVRILWVQRDEFGFQ